MIQYFLGEGKRGEVNGCLLVEIGGICEQEQFSWTCNPTWPPAGLDIAESGAAALQGIVRCWHPVRVLEASVWRKPQFGCLFLALSVSTDSSGHDVERH